MLLKKKEGIPRPPGWILGFQEEIGNHRSADSDCWNIDLSPIPNSTMNCSSQTVSEIGEDFLVMVKPVQFFFFFTVVHWITHQRATQNRGCLNAVVVTVYRKRARGAYYIW